MKLVDMHSKDTYFALLKIVDKRTARKIIDSLPETEMDYREAYNELNKKVTIVKNELLEEKEEALNNHGYKDCVISVNEILSMMCFVG